MLINAKYDVFLRVFCPPDCKAQPSYWSPVIGNNIYTDVSNTFLNVYLLTFTVIPWIFSFSYLFMRF